MNVSDLQNMLGVIQQLLTSAGSKAAGEIQEFSAALEPFRDLKAKQLTNELRKLTEQPKPPKKNARQSPAEVDALIGAVCALYERAGASTTTQEEIDEKTKSLSGLGKADVGRAAEAIGLKGMKSKTIPAIAAEIKKRIEARMGAAQKTGMIDVLGSGAGGQ